MADGARVIKMLGDVLTELREGRAENQRLHAHTDVVIQEAVDSAISKHDDDPHAHRGRISALERRMTALEEKVRDGGEG